MDEGGEHDVELLEAREDAAEAFDLGQALDLVAPAIEAAVVGPGVERMRLGGTTGVKPS